MEKEQLKGGGGVTRTDRSRVQTTGIVVFRDNGCSGRYSLVRSSDCQQIAPPAHRQLLPQSRGPVLKLCPPVGLLAQRGPPAPLLPPHGPLLLLLSAPGPGRPRRACFEASGQCLLSEFRFALDRSCRFCKMQGSWTFKYHRMGGKYLKHKSDRLTGEDARGEASKLRIRLQENTSWGWDGLAPDSRPTFERLVSKSQSWGGGEAWVKRQDYERSCRKNKAPQTALWDVRSRQTNRQKEANDDV